MPAPDRRMIDDAFPPASMSAPRFAPGLILSGMYVVLCVYLIATQGLFGESFIAIILGLPLSMAFAAIEFGNATGPLLYVMIFLPLAVNALVLYRIGSLFGKKKV